MRNAGLIPSSEAASGEGRDCGIRPDQAGDRAKVNKAIRGIRQIVRVGCEQSDHASGSLTGVQRTTVEAGGTGHPIVHRMVWGGDQEEQMAYFMMGSRYISIEQVDGFGKRPGLWIGNAGQMTKVASFNSFQHAYEFEEWLRMFFGDRLEEGEDELQR